MKQVFILFISVLVLAGCAQPAKKSGAVSEIKLKDDRAIATFSQNQAGGLPEKWEPLIIHRNKKPTHYQLIKENNKTIMHARADGASSGLMQHVSIDPLNQPWLNWQWRIGNLIESADNYERHAEDSPARIILGFDGDKDSMPFADQILFETAKVLTGHDFPYATLMYVWENKAPVGTIIDSTRTSRIKMIVAASGPEGVGQWRNFTRNIAEDYEKAFGEKPGRLIGVGIMTDTDNTGEVVDAWYGDLRLLNKPNLAQK
ncbi:MAG: DUF3047 domain-containing protein [Burkholderiaceae bacterium]